MSATTTAPAATGIAGVFNLAAHYGTMLLSLLEKAGEDWTAIKASPFYQTAVPLLTSVVTAEAGAAGVPLINVADAVANVLDALAAASPTIATPPGSTP